ncbi:MAG: hypothetical protein PHO02_04160 [Candidatus Nanoarchaeia archaeon]|nr:hypothetical protein [Candidatus Nanoarchaeia archaeon]
MADYKTLKHEEQNLEMNTGNSLTSAAVMYVNSFAATVGAICINASGDSRTAMYSAGIAALSLLASGFCGMSHDRDKKKLEEVRKELKGLEGKVEE